MEVRSAGWGGVMYAVPSCVALAFMRGRETGDHRRKTDDGYVKEAGAGLFHNASAGPLWLHEPFMELGS
jgi:hypothetical protein